MFQTGNITDFERMLGDILDRATMTSADMARRVEHEAAAKGGAMTGRHPQAIEQQVAPIHEGAIGQVMRLIVQFSQRSKVSIPDLSEIARPKLTAFTSATMKPMIVAATRVGSPAQLIDAARDRFVHRVDSALRDVEIGFIQGSAIMSQSESVQSNALRMLQAIYDKTRDQENPVDDVTKLDIRLISEEDSRAAWRYLKGKGLIQTFNLDYAARINAQGVDAIENARRHPDQPSHGFPLTTYNMVTYNTFQVGTAISSPFQVAGAQSTQSLATTYGSQELSDIERLVSELTTHLSELNLDSRQKQKAETQIATLKAQLTDEPDPVILKQAGRTLRNVIEGAIGSLIATAAQQPSVWQWIGQAMASLFP